MIKILVFPKLDFFSIGLINHFWLCGPCRRICKLFSCCWRLAGATIATWFDMVDDYEFYDLFCKFDLLKTIEADFEKW